MTNARRAKISRLQDDMNALLEKLTALRDAEETQIDFMPDTERNEERRSAALDCQDALVNACDTLEAAISDMDFDAMMGEEM